MTLVAEGLTSTGLRPSVRPNWQWVCGSEWWVITLAFTPTHRGKIPSAFCANIRRSVPVMSCLSSGSSVRQHELDLRTVVWDGRQHNSVTGISVCLFVCLHVFATVLTVWLQLISRRQETRRWDLGVKRQKRGYLRFELLFALFGSLLDTCNRCFWTRVTGAFDRDLRWREKTTSVVVRCYQHYLYFICVLQNFLRHIYLYMKELSLTLEGRDVCVLCKDPFRTAQ